MESHSSRDPEPGPNEPPRLQQRWVIILSLATTTALTLSIAASAVVGVPVGIAVVGLLHTIMD